MRDSNVANAAKESTQGEFSHGLLEFRKASRRVCCQWLGLCERRLRKSALSLEEGEWALPMLAKPFGAVLSLVLRLVVEVPFAVSGRK